jgi:hypothetical protein
MGKRNPYTGSRQGMQTRCPTVAVRGSGWKLGFWGGTRQHDVDGRGRLDT